MATKRRRKSANDVTLNVSDWNYEDKWYRLAKPELIKLATAVKTLPVDRAWESFVEMIKSGSVTRCDECVDHTLDEYFFDYNDPVGSVDEWDVPSE